MSGRQISSVEGELIFQNRVPGKILLSGEYVVLDGATALGLASRLGQSMEVYRGGVPGLLHWTAYNHLHKPWLQVTYQWVNRQWALHGTKGPASAEIEMLLNWLQTAWNLIETQNQLTTDHPSPWADILQNEGLMVQTRIDFPRGWGLGSSATALALLAKWLGVDARLLYALTQNGSGYDLEVALQDSSILYQWPTDSRNNNSISVGSMGPIVQKINYRLPMNGQLWLIDSGSKQISSKEVFRYHNIDQKLRVACVPEISSISIALAACTEVPVMMEYLVQHDAIMERLLRQPSLHRLTGNSFPGRLKSLGAWGGDLFLAVTNRPDEALIWLNQRREWSLQSFDQIIHCES